MKRRKNKSTNQKPTSQTRKKVCFICVHPFSPEANFFFNPEQIKFEAIDENCVCSVACSVCRTHNLFCYLWLKAGSGTRNKMAPEMQLRLIYCSSTNLFFELKFSDLVLLCFIYLRFCLRLHLLKPVIALICTYSSLLLPQAALLRLFLFLCQCAQTKQFYFYRF